MDESATTPPADGCTPTHADTPHLLGGEDAQTLHLLAGDDIVDRLIALFWAMKDAGRVQDKKTVADAISEIERLQVQVRRQAFELMIAHSEAAGLYGITMDDQHSVDETGVISQQHSDYVGEGNE